MATPIGTIPNAVMIGFLKENHNIEIPIFEWNKEKFIRLSIHIYNDQKDIDSLMNALRSII